MGKMLFINQKGPKKPKKKPGWQDAAYEHDQWLKGVNSMTLFGDKPKPKGRSTLPSKMPQLGAVVREKQRATGESKVDVGVAGTTKKVLRPEIEYADNPEMLERELKARERKFLVAPAYNKSGDMLVTPEMLKDIKTGGARRRS